MASVVSLTDNIGSFSAVCWLFGRDLYRKYGRPIGLIATWFGGTRIEAWSSPDALKKCFTTVSMSVFEQNVYISLESLCNSCALVTQETSRV